MSLLYKVIVAARCSSTHHKLAMDALRHLQGHESERWRNLFLKHYESYLEGAKAPDKTFRDFKNHVLHVRENYWGGAIQAVSTWYGRAVDAFRDRDWEQGVYSAGVLSHYYTDPIQPFHTGQTEEEGSIHRAAEWSIAKSYEELQEMLERDLGGYPKMDAPSGDDWLADMVRRGAEVSNPHYETVIDHYDLDQGVKNPPAGLDSALKERVARLIGYAAVGLARILEQAFRDARVAPPVTMVTLHGFLATLKIPIFWVSRKLADRRERAVVEMIYEEVRRTGKAVILLPDDDREVRRMHAKEVLKIPIERLNARKPRPTGKKHGQRIAPGELPSPLPPRDLPRAEPKWDPHTLESSHSDQLGQVPLGLASRRQERSAAELPTTGRPEYPSLRFARTEAEPPTPHRVEFAGDRDDRPSPDRSLSPRRDPKASPPAPRDEQSSRRELRFHLEPTSDIVDAPSIGSKTAKRLRAVGIHTVSDLLACDPDEVAPRLGKRWVTAATIRDWQAQASMVCRVPGLRGHHAQILVACGVTEPEQLAQATPHELHCAVERFAESADGQRNLWSRAAPEPDEVRRWIEWAQHARLLRAA